MFEEEQKFFSREEEPAKIKPTPRERLERRTPRHPYEAPEEAVLESYDKRDAKKLSGGINHVELVQLKDDGSGVFKPVQGEISHFNFGVIAGSLYKRERAAYLVNRFLNFDLVPPTVIREIDGVLGSLQQFINDAEPGYEIDDSKHQLLYWKMQIFDYLIGNADRHFGNFLVKSDRLYAIDHGYSFVESCRHDISRYSGRVLPADLVAGLKEFWENEELKGTLRELLGELLSPDEVGGFFQRLKRVVESISEDGVLKEMVKEKAPE